MVKDTLFYEDSYINSFKAKVIDCIIDNNKIKLVLSNTAFYPEGGGQPSDIGTINDAKVIHVEEKNGIIYHIVDKEIKKGTEVIGNLDFNHRFWTMQNHSGEHIVSGITCKNFNATNVGFHIGTDFTTLDFNKELNKDDISFIEKEANEAIYKNIEIKIRIVSNEEAQNIEYRSKIDLKEDVRLVEIPGYDICACCGMHVKKTGEIGLIKIVRFEKYKSGTRVYMLAGRKALEDYNMKQEAIYNASHLLSSKVENVPDAIESLLDEIEKYKIDISKLKNKLFEYDVKSIKKEKNNIIEYDDLDFNDMKKLAELLIDKADNIYGVVSNNKFLLLSKEESLKEKLNRLKEKMPIKGGGRESMIQGQFEGNSKEFIEFFRS